MRRPVERTAWELLAFDFGCPVCTRRASECACPRDQFESEEEEYVSVRRLRQELTNLNLTPCQVEVVVSSLKKH